MIFAMSSIPVDSFPDDEGYVPEYEYVHEPIPVESVHPAGTYYDACEPFEYDDDFDESEDEEYEEYEEYEVEVCKTE